MLGAILEYLIESFLFSWKESTWSWIGWVGLFGAITSQCIRSMAIITAGSNFTHLVAQEKKENHRLVTCGIYSYVLYSTSI